ncbi:MarR family winged helix-turn-helix transcriptional regulator [Citricoccus sp. K5]|uniref:MarR family winged helix-turn-helix transcriptional regulator n=1 Tax=Citricoccus sp. K5 TaxID=2653135 RepID=UPI0012F08B6E|nr:MarR family transcriptional regulator [Citricoccus sp. K5]VXB79859.1 DNA-binding MarR family transcriptional regulator [Citricoccus sp. K5]
MSQSGQESAELFQLIHALRRYAEVADRTVDAAGHRSGLHRTDLRALTILMQRQAAGLNTSPTDLGRMLSLTSASTTALVDRLVANGHAQRTPSTTDRRRVSISHTDTAAVDGRKIFMPMARTMTDRLSGFTPEQMQTAIEVLAAATEALDSFEAQAAPPPPHVQS